ncbi:MAG: hypothetical protein U0Q16_27715 [Bryobacteraceae bacterium]
MAIDIAAILKLAPLAKSVVEALEGPGRKALGFDAWSKAVDAALARFLHPNPGGALSQPTTAGRRLWHGHCP